MKDTFTLFYIITFIHFFIEEFICYSWTDPVSRTELWLISRFCSIINYLQFTRAIPEWFDKVGRRGVGQRQVVLSFMLLLAGVPKTAYCSFNFTPLTKVQMQNKCQIYPQPVHSLCLKYCTNKCFHIYGWRKKGKINQFCWRTMLIRTKN